MGNSVSTSGLLQSRTVKYDVLGASSVVLNYVNMTYSIRYVDIGRQQVKKIYRFSFRFVIAGTSTTDLNNILNNCERVLSMRGGSLQVIEDGQYLVNCNPALTSPVISASPSVTNSTTRDAILTDIEWGPRPISFTNEGIIGGLAATATWVVEVTTAAEDSFKVADFLVLGVDAEIAYGIDQNHFTTRTVTGRVYTANFGRSGQNFVKDITSQADIDALRQALVSTTANLPANTFIAPIRIPPNFIRTTETWQVDNTENVLSFLIVDREVYRLFPALITNADCRISFTVSGSSAVQWCAHQIAGFVESPRDVSKIRVLTAAWEIIQDAAPFIYFQTAIGRAYVHDFTFVNYVYQNRIDFLVHIMTPYGNFDYAKQMGIGVYRSELFFPPGTAGSAQIFGSAYRTESPTISIPTYISTPFTETVPGSYINANLQEGAAESAALGNADRLIHIEIRCYGNHKSGLKKAVPNNTTGSVETYQTTPDDYDMYIEISYSQIVEEGDEVIPDFVTSLESNLQNIPDIEIKEIYNSSPSSLASQWKNLKLKKGYACISFLLKGSLRDQIQQNGGVDAFANFLDTEWEQSLNETLSEAITKFLTVGH